MKAIVIYIGSAAPPQEESEERSYKASVDENNAEEHLGAAWTRQSLTDGEELLVLSSPVTIARLCEAGSNSRSARQSKVLCLLCPRQNLLCSI